MSAPTLTEVGGPLTAELQLRLGMLAQLSRKGFVGRATVLCQVKAMQALAGQLAVAEESAARLTAEAREIALAERTDHRALIGAVVAGMATGKVVLLDDYRHHRAHPCALPFHDAQPGGAA